MRRLRQGDTVALIAPSGPPDPLLLARGRHVLGGLGLNVVVAARALSRRRYLAGPDFARAADLQEAWCDPAVQAIVCVRGGYGATRLLDLLDWDAMAAAEPKPLVGSSDVTALHQALSIRLGVPSMFGPMAACQALGGPDGPEPHTFAHFRGSLFEGAAARPIPGTAVLVPGQASGPVIGGNLSLLAALCGTPYALRAEGRIVLLEDVTEAPYRIDRMVTQLLQAGCLQGAAGIALGSWVDCGDPLPILAELLTPLEIPVIAGLPLGHGSPQFSVWLGADGAIDTESCSLAGTLRDRETAS
ncbi:LD-carboxypeptidase [Streptosporangiaceae bacterium NEAU-GS5]|nr:LD-carboxypeptidase [Streptosporangiaceae bacterium NEAU-GS5]